MNVAIAGNSNCIFRNGFSHGVEQFLSGCGGAVRNYSLGGSCCALHIYTFHDKYEELMDADVVVLDSLVIDTFHWKRGIIDESELLALIDDMYALYSTLPAKVVSIFFPIEKYVRSYEHLPTYKAHLGSAKKYGVDFLDLYSLMSGRSGDCSRYFMQPSHIKENLASEIGYKLAEVCCKNVRVGKKVYPLNSPYEVIGGELLSGLESVSVESSRYKANCFKLDRGVSLESISGKSLVGAFHWNKDCVSRFVLSSDSAEDVVHFRSKYAFFEVLNSKRKIESDSIVRPGVRTENVTQAPAGKERVAEYGIPQLAGLLVRGCEKISTMELCDNKDLSGHFGSVFR